MPRLCVKTAFDSETGTLYEKGKIYEIPEGSLFSSCFSIGAPPKSEPEKPLTLAEAAGVKPNPIRTPAKGKE